MVSICLQDVTKRFDNGHLAAKNLNLEISDGEFMVIVGPSGCGKSTTLRLIAGLESVTAGSIVLGDRCANDLSPRERDVAMVFQNHALYPHMSVRDNLAFGLRSRRLSENEVQERIMLAAEMLSIESLLDCRPPEMSGGQQQLVSVGRAIVRQPTAFLFDEPLSHLDAHRRVQMRVKLSLMHQRLKTTTVYVTHDQVEAMTLGDRIAVMNEGVIQQVDTPLNLYRHPANRFVAGFIGSPSMNFLEGSLKNNVFQAGAIRYSLENRADFPDGDYTLGFRPEDINTQANKESPSPLATTVVEIVERMGHETIVHWRWNGVMAVARLVGDVGLKPGDPMQIQLPVDKWYLFGTDGRRVN